MSFKRKLMLEHLETINARQKKTTLTLSFLLLSCCGVEKSFPDAPVFVADVKNNVCAEYKVTDPVAIKYKLVKEHPLAKCQDVTGFDKKGFKKVQNWARDVIQDLLKRLR